MNECTCVKMQELVSITLVFTEVTTVEGLLTAVHEGLEQLQEERRVLD